MTREKLGQVLVLSLLTILGTACGKFSTGGRAPSAGSSLSPEAAAEYSPRAIAAPDMTLAFKDLSATGNIAQGSQEFVASAATGFRAGDDVIVEIGGEAGQGMRGTAGVGGVFAAKTTDVNLYYINTDAPRALVAKVTAVSADGRTVTLDKAAVNSATGAKIYFDNLPVWKAAMDLTGTHSLQIPAGRFAVSDFMPMNWKNGWTVQGMGKDQTEIFSPKGTPSASLGIFEAKDVTLAKFHFHGNARMNGYGPGTGENYAPGIMFTSSANGSVQEVRVTDVFTAAVGTRYSNDVWAYKVDVHLTDGFPHYIQWMFGWANSKGGGAVDSSVESSILTAGFEGFQCEGVSFIRVRGVNASMSMNSSGRFLIKDANLVFKANSWTNDNSFHRFNPLININSNINNSQQVGYDPVMAAGGLIENAVMLQEGYINAQQSILKGITINGGNPNITIRGGHYTAPNVGTGNDLGPRGVDSTGENTIVDGFRVDGDAGAGGVNIAVQNGIVRNSIARSIQVVNGSTANNSQP